MFECVPNISEGRDREIIDSIANAVAATPGVHLLHLHTDPDHNRSVLTYVSAKAEPIVSATLALYEQALQRIDLRKHTGEHPRIGAVDVTPFVPLAGTAMKECITLAESVGQ